MTLFNTTTRSSNATARGNQQAQPQGQREFTPARLWLNVGKVFVALDENGEVQTTFIGTPLGMGMDTMNDAKGNSTIAQAKNSFKEELVDCIETLNPGEEVILNLTEDMIPQDLTKGDAPVQLDGLFIQLRKANDETSRPVAGNPFVSAMSKNRLKIR